MPDPSSSSGKHEHESAVPVVPAHVELERQAAELAGDILGGSTAEPDLTDRIKTILIGKPRDPTDAAVFKHISLVAFLAWVGLGADGLSSSCYGPAEAFHALGAHVHLAVPLALATIVTVLVIASCYSHIIEEFPSGGGGYLVASKLLGRPAGVISGCALLVDYVLTITVSVAAMGDALFGLVGPEWVAWKLPAQTGVILLLVLLNLRGVKESVQFLLPVFLLFLVTHAVLIVGTLTWNIGGLGRLAEDVSGGFRSDLSNPTFGLFAAMALFLRAYSMGAGTYTGIEAVSNSMPVMREPRVQTGKRTMLYMALSLSLVAGGLILGYLLLGIRPVEGQTMNQSLTTAWIREIGMEGTLIGGAFILALMISEGALLGVAAQAGFIDGPRILANMAQDSWMPHWFANLSERLTTHNGILLMGAAALGALWYTQGDVIALITMYSINVFLTFSLSMLGMSRHWYIEINRHPLARRRLVQFLFGAVLCLLILGITVFEKFTEGGWLTLGVTGSLVVVCFLINRYYLGVMARLRALDQLLDIAVPLGPPNLNEPDPKKPTAAILVGGYSGLGVHTLLNMVRFAPGHFQNVLFLSAGVIDSGNFKGVEAVADLERYTRTSLDQYLRLARQLGLPCRAYMAMGIDPVETLEQLCTAVAKQYSGVVIFAGQLVFQRDKWYQHLLHNKTAFALQRRLQWDGVPMVILPSRVR